MAILKKKIISAVLMICLIMSLMPNLKAHAATVYSPRLSAPGYDNGYYYSNKNPYYKSGYGMPNCTAYAYGRVYEILGYEPRLSLQGAGYWWSDNINNGWYSYGSTPKLGAVACWDQWSVSYGHVAVVEQINSDGSVVISESSWGGIVFRTQTMNADGSGYYGNMRFLGYIYPLTDAITAEEAAAAEAAQAAEEAAKAEESAPVEEPAPAEEAAPVVEESAPAEAAPAAEEPAKTEETVQAAPATPAFDISSVSNVSYGSNNNSVKKLQSLLNQFGFSCGPVDGYFGYQTYSAVRSFQSAKRLVVDGYVGNQTWTALANLANNGTTTAAAPAPASTETTAAATTTTTQSQASFDYTKMAGVSYGSVNSSVGSLQKLLNNLGYNAGPVDNYFGSQTRLAVTRYQRDHGLVVDGYCGPQTWKSLANA